MKIKFKKLDKAESFLRWYHFDTTGGNARGVEMNISFLFTPDGLKMAEPTEVEDYGVKNYHVVKEGGEPLPKADIQIYLCHGFIYDRGRDIEKPDREEILTVGDVDVEVESIEALRPNAAVVHIKGEGLYYPRGYIYAEDYVLVRENEITLLKESDEVREHLIGDVLYILRAEYVRDNGKEHRSITVYPAQKF